jgi:hypothetical protein
VLAFCALPASAQERGNDEARVSPNASVSQTIGTTEVTITYGRPKVKGRTIFGDLVPYDTVWRTGANEATTISFSDDVMIDGEPVEAGTYSLFTVPGEDEWTVILNSVAQQWGAYDYDESEDVLRLSTTPGSAPMQEMLTFRFEDVNDGTGTCVMHWAETRVDFTISTQGGA